MQVIITTANIIDYCRQNQDVLMLLYLK